MSTSKPVTVKVTLSLSSSFTNAHDIYFSLIISCLMFSNVAALSIILTFQHATLRGSFLSPAFVVRVSLADDLGCLTPSTAKHDATNLMLRDPVTAVIYVLHFISYHVMSRGGTYLPGWFPGALPVVFVFLSLLLPR